MGVWFHKEGWSVYGDAQRAAVAQLLCTTRTLDQRRAWWPSWLAAPQAREPWWSGSPAVIPLVDPCPDLRTQCRGVICCPGSQGACWPRACRRHSRRSCSSCRHRGALEPPRCSCSTCPCSSHLQQERTQSEHKGQPGPLEREGQWAGLLPQAPAVCYPQEGACGLRACIFLFFFKREVEISVLWP